MEKKGPILLSIDCQSYRIRRYYGPFMTWNHQFNRMPYFSEVQQFRDIHDVSVPLKEQS